MRINNNISALNTFRQYTTNTGSTNKSMEKLSSGLRINRAGDDAAGLAISEKMRAQIRGIEMAAKNSQDAISLVQTAEGALTETHSILQRMNELAVQSSSDTNEDIDRDALQSEFSQLSAEINDIAKQTKFNNKYLLDGTYAGARASVLTSGFADGISVTGDTTISDAITTVGTVNDWAATQSAAAGTGTATLAGTPAGVTSTTAVGSTVSTGSTYNGTYYLKAAGSALTAMTFSLVDAEGATVATSSTTTVTAGSATTLDFGNYGDMSLTLAAGATAANITDAFGAGDATGTTYVIAGGEDAVSVPSATIGGQFVKEGDTSVTLATGLTMDISSLTTEDWASQDALNTALFGSTSGSGTVNAMLMPAKPPLTIQTGANSGETLDIAIGAMDTESLELENISVDNKANAQSAVDKVTNAINTVSTQRANLGAYQNRLEHKINNLNTSAENLQAAESRIRDVDMAQEMVEFTKNNILLQAAQSMLAQANAQPQGVLQLLQ